MGKKPAGVSGGLGGLLELPRSAHFKLCHPEHKFCRVTANPYAGELKLALKARHFFEEEGLGCWCWVHVVRLVDGANLPRRMISARKESSFCAIVGSSRQFFHRPLQITGLI